MILCALCKFPSNLDDPKYLRKGLSKVITVGLHILPGLTDEFYVVMQEARCMTKARRLGVYTPALYAMDPLLYTLTLEYVEGPAVKEVLLAFGEDGIIEERLDDLATQIGEAIGKLHDGGLIHGDLTTSNMLIQSGTNRLVSEIITYSVTPFHSMQIQGKK